MVVFLHVVIALLSIGVASLGFFRPSVLTLRTNYGLIAATLGSGTYLIISTPSHAMEACFMGIIYISLVLAATIMAKIRLARIEKGTL